MREWEYKELDQVTLLKVVFFAFVVIGLLAVGYWMMTLGSDDNIERIEPSSKPNVDETATTKQTSNFYWSQLQKKARFEYEKARIIYAEWSKLNIPYFYDQNIKKQISKIKHMTFKIPQKVNYSSRKNNIWTLDQKHQ